MRKLMLNKNAFSINFRYHFQDTQAYPQLGTWTVMFTSTFVFGEINLKEKCINPEMKSSVVAL